VPPRPGGSRHAVRGIAGSRESLATLVLSA